MPTNLPIRSLAPPGCETARVGDGGTRDAASREVEVRLIDVARVARMNALTRWRWVVKDLAQFWYSTMQIPAITDAQRERWLSDYAQRRRICWGGRLRAAVAMKARSIARHDAKLKQSQPMRNVSIPDEGGR